MTPTRRRNLHRPWLLAIALPALLAVGGPRPATNSLPQTHASTPGQSEVEFLYAGAVNANEVGVGVPSRFRSGSDGLDWERLAEEHFDEFDFVLLDPHRTSRTLHTAIEHSIVRRLAAESLFGYTDVPYEAPLPAELVGSDFFLISASGITLLRPKNLQGIVRFRSNRPGTVILGLTHYGGMAAETPEGILFSQHGFVVEERRPTITGRPGRRAVIRIVESRIRRARIEVARRRRLAGLPRNTGLWHSEGTDYRPLNSFTFRIEDDDAEYVFIQWAPDSCDGVIEISRGDQPGQPLVEDLYGCDI